LRRSRLDQRRHRRPQRRIGLAALFGTAVHQFVTGLAQALHGTQNLAVAVRFGGVIKQQFGDTFVASVRNRAPGAHLDVTAPCKGACQTRLGLIQVKGERGRRFVN
jgi:hypothetical protein